FHATGVQTCALPISNKKILKQEMLKGFLVTLSKFFWLMKIAIVCYPTFGGSGVVATELGLELAKKGHEIHFITYNQPVRLELLSPNIYYHEVNVPEYPLFHYQPYELALSSKIVD